jgi:hypothetical protein
VQAVDAPHGLTHGAASHRTPRLVAVARCVVRTALVVMGWCRQRSDQADAPSYAQTKLVTWRGRRIGGETTALDLATRGAGPGGGDAARMWAREARRVRRVRRVRMRMRGVRVEGGGLHGRECGGLPPYAAATVRETCPALWAWAPSTPSARDAGTSAPRLRSPCCLRWEVGASLSPSLDVVARVIETSEHVCKAATRRRLHAAPRRSPQQLWRRAGP